MDDLKWYGLIGPAIVYFFFFVREIKEIFFDKDDNGETFGVKLKRAVFLSGERKTKVSEPRTIKYSDDERKIAIDNLLIHNFFICVSKFRNELPNMEFSGSIKKNKILREVILLYIETIEEHASDFIKENKLDELTTLELNEKLKFQIKIIDHEIYSKLRERLSEDVYSMIIDHPVKGFRARNGFLREILIDGVLSITTQSMSVYGYDNYKRVSEALTSMYISVLVIVRNFEKVFKDFNGELENLLEQNR